MFSQKVVTGPICPDCVVYYSRSFIMIVGWSEMDVGRRHPSPIAHAIHPQLALKLVHKMNHLSHRKTNAIRQSDKNNQ